MLDVMYNPFSLAGKTILVTGASSGIGKATAIECSRLGAKVIVVGRNEERLNETYSLLDGDGHIPFLVDLTSDESLGILSQEVPVIDGLVNAAGIVKTVPFTFVKRSDLQNIFAINFCAPTLLSKSLIRNKKLKKGASIVFVSSIDGPVTAHVANSVYAASKGAISAMAKNMALDLAPKQIRVNTVLPGMTDTPLVQGDSFTQEDLEKDMRLYPLKRFAKSDEIAWAIIYFLSDASSFTTGTSLVVDGGFTIQ